MITTTRCCILFADIVDSMRYYGTLGDGPARRLLARAVHRMSRAAETHRGLVVKTIGDEVMCTFPDPNDAALAARAMHNELEDLSVILGLTEQVNAHIGLHHGVVIQDGGDVFGDAVNVAARLVGLAKPRESVTSETTLALLNADEKERAHLTNQTTIKGKVGKFDIYELSWEEGLTTAPLLVEVKTAFPTRLRFWCGGVVQEVSLTRSGLSIGRHAHNDFIADHQAVSRTHAHIRWRNDRYYLSDVSTNGTYVCEEGKQGVWVWRDELELQDSGTIGLGEPVLRDDVETIYYKVVA